MKKPETLAQADLRLALSVLHGRRRPFRHVHIRCRSCGVLFYPIDLRPEFNEDDRIIGWVCYGCG